MAHVYKCSEWSNTNGRWFCGDVEDLANDSNAWWIPCRILGIAPTDFILLLKDTFHASNFSYNINANVLIFSWDKQSDMRKYKNWINDKARKANYII